VLSSWEDDLSDHIASGRSRAPTKMLGGDLSGGGPSSRVCALAEPRFRRPPHAQSTAASWRSAPHADARFLSSAASRTKVVSQPNAAALAELRARLAIAAAHAIKVAQRARDSVFATRKAAADARREKRKDGGRDRRTRRVCPPDSHPTPRPPAAAASQESVDSTENFAAGASEVRLDSVRS
jgi:hypothetical protein